MFAGTQRGIMLQLIWSRSGQNIFIWSQRITAAGAELEPEWGSGTLLPNSLTFEGKRLYKCLSSLFAHWLRFHCQSWNSCMKEKRTDGQNLHPNITSFYLTTITSTQTRSHPMWGWWCKAAVAAREWVKAQISSKSSNKVESEGVFFHLPMKHLTEF